MSTGLLISSGSDFDSIFATGSGTQLFYIYTNAGVDVGQRYLPASSGTAYGTTNWKNASGTDVGTLLCKIETGSAGMTWTASMSLSGATYTLKVGFKRTGSNTSVTVTSATATFAGSYTSTDNGSDSGQSHYVSFNNGTVSTSGTLSGLSTSSYKYLTGSTTISSPYKYSYSDFTLGGWSFSMTATAGGKTVTVTATSGSF